MNLQIKHRLNLRTGNYLQLGTLGYLLTKCLWFKSLNVSLRRKYSFHSFENALERYLKRSKSSAIYSIGLIVRFVLLITYKSFKKYKKPVITINNKFKE